MLESPWACHFISLLFLLHSHEIETKYIFRNPLHVCERIMHSSFLGHNSHKRGLKCDYWFNCTFKFTNLLLPLPFSVADTLLWKDKRQTLMTLLILIAIYYNFVASQSTIITALSKLLLVVSIFLFVHGNLPERMYVSSPFYFPSQYVNLLFLNRILYYLCKIQCQMSMCSINRQNVYICHW